MIDFVRVEKFCELSSWDEKLVRQTILLGRWREGVHWLVAPDGKVLINLRATSNFKGKPPEEYPRIFRSPLELKDGAMNIAQIHRGSGVYFLFKGPELIYIGQAKKLIVRIGQHMAEGKKDFDRVGCINCDICDLNKIETAYIYLMQPPLNRRGLSS